VTPDVLLRPVRDSDLPDFFEIELDPVGRWMAAFTSKDAHDRAAFDAHRARLAADPTVIQRTIELDGRVAGGIVCFGPAHEREIAFWIGRDLWGRGVATRALGAFLVELAERPLRARAAADNAGSIRVLEKCGFRLVERSRFFANARGAEIEEVLLMLGT
jgi:RimJ/RimL family protein N-acetyltransferase